MPKTLDISLLLEEYKHSQESLNNATELFDNAAPHDVDKALDELEKYQLKLFLVACQIVDILIDDT